MLHYYTYGYWWYRELPNGRYWAQYRAPSDVRPAQEFDSWAACRAAIGL